MVNERGGINGRKVNLISLDDSYAPPKTVEQTRRLVESDEVALIFSSIGTAHNTAIAKYLQGKNIPQLFLASGASKFADIAQFPQANVGRAGAAPLRGAALCALCTCEESERQIRGDFAERRFRPRLSRGPERRARRQIRFRRHGATYEISDPTIDSQIVKLKASGADVFVIAATPKFAAQSIRKAFEIGWRPMTFLSNVAVWISTVMEPAGVEAGTGILSTAYVKDPDDPAWKDDAGVKGWREFMTKYVPDGDQHDTNYVNAYNSAMVLEAVLKAWRRCCSTFGIRRPRQALLDAASTATRTADAAAAAACKLDDVHLPTSPAVPFDQESAAVAGLACANGKSCRVLRYNRAHNWRWTSAGAVKRRTPWTRISGSTPMRRRNDGGGATDGELTASCPAAPEAAPRIAATASCNSRIGGNTS